MPGIAVAAFAKAVAAPAHRHVSVANRCSNACRRRWNEISVSVAAPSKAHKYSSAGLFFGEPRLSVDALFTSKAGFSSLSSKGSRFSHIGSLLPSSFGRDKKLQRIESRFPSIVCLLPPPIEEAHPSTTRPRTPLEPLRAYLDFPHNIPYQKFSTKPECWWWTLSCIPYLMALQLSDSAFYFVPLMERHEQFEFLSYYVPGAIRRLLSWFLMVYCSAIYVGVVRNRKWPHYFRHHMMMGLLLKNCIQITWYTSNFLPLICYNESRIDIHPVAVGVHEVHTCGKYMNLPFTSDAAYNHTPYLRLCLFACKCI